MDDEPLIAGEAVSCKCRFVSCLAPDRRGMILRPVNEEDLLMSKPEEVFHCGAGAALIIRIDVVHLGVPNRPAYRDKGYFNLEKVPQALVIASDPEDHDPIGDSVLCHIPTRILVVLLGIGGRKDQPNPLLVKEVIDPAQELKEEEVRGETARCMSHDEPNAPYPF